MFLRIALFSITLWLAAAGPWYFFILLAVWYTVRYISPEILILTIVADSYFLITPDGYPWYTIAFTLVLLVLLWLRPHIAMYN